MKRKMARAISVGLIFSAFSFSSFAVDGYKGVKFGSSVEHVIKSNLCTFSKSKDNVRGRDSYKCSDFMFAGSNTNAIAIFLNGKFQRLAIQIDSNGSVVVDELRKKYGQPSSNPTKEDLNRFLKSGGDLSVQFDKDTIIFRTNKNLSSEKEGDILIYTSPDYNTILLELQSNNVAGDL